MQMQKIGIQTNQRQNNVNFKAGEVVIKETNLIKKGMERNFNAENALKKLFNNFLPQNANYKASLEKAPAGTQIIPRIGGADNHFFIDVKAHGVTKDTYGTDPIEVIKNEESIGLLANNLSRALNTRV